MPFKTKAFKCISLVLFVLVFINTSQAQKIKIDGVGVVVGKNIVLDHNWLAQFSTGRTGRPDTSFRRS